LGRPSAGYPRPRRSWPDGRSPSDISRGGKRARAEIEPISDVRGSRDFRLQLAENILVKFYHDATESVFEKGLSAHGVRKGTGVEPAFASEPSGPIGPFVGKSIPHEAAQAHVTGQAVYLDDIPPFRNELLVEFIGSPLVSPATKIAHARRRRNPTGVSRPSAAQDADRSSTTRAPGPDECHHVGLPIVASPGGVAKPSAARQQSGSS
jgi:hypothetical protein